MYPTLTIEQVEALQRFAAMYGRGWKAKLSEVYWYNARIWDDSNGDNRLGYVLHGLRNSHGPDWLAQVNLRKLPIVT